MSASARPPPSPSIVTRSVIPEGYERRRTRGARALVIAAAADWLVEVLGSGRTVHEWAGRQPGAEPLRGRGTVYSVGAPAAGAEGRERWAVRHYRRGGAVAPLLGDRYARMGPPRPELETLTSVAARARGIPTPAVVAGVWYPAGAFYRADLITELLPGAKSLADLLFAGERPEGMADALEIAGTLVRESAARGLSHPDLNAMNVLVTFGDAGPEGHLLDLDRATVTEIPSASSGTAMLERLERSLRKLAGSSDRPMDKADLSALRAGFEGKT